MFKASETIRTIIGPLDAILANLAFVVGITQAPLMSAVITALRASIAGGVWRAVRILGHLLERAQEDAVPRKEAHDLGWVREGSLKGFITRQA